MKQKSLAVRLRRYLITGFVVVVPVVLTVYILAGLFVFVDRILGRFLTVYLHHLLGFYIPGIGFVLFFLLILGAGFFASNYIGRTILHRLELWFAGLPVINKIYPIFKQMTQFITAQKEFGFRKVVLVEYPSKGIWSLGFLTNEQFKKLQEITGREMAAVLIPSVPNPLTGFVFYFPKDEVRMTDLAIPDAVKIIISGGVYTP